MKVLHGLHLQRKFYPAGILLSGILIVSAFAGCTPKATASTVTIVESNEPPDSTATITWQQAPDYKGLDVMVTVTGPIVGTNTLISPGITALMGAELGVGLDLYFPDPSLFDPSWVGKTLTVVGEIINSPYESVELDVTSASQVISVK